MLFRSGASDDEMPKLRAAFEAQSRVGSRNPNLIPTLLAGFDLMWDFTDRLVREREANPASEPNMLDEFIAAKNAGTIDEKELRYLIMTLFPAGYDTSKNALALILHYMIDRPDAWRRCAEDLPYCRRVTEEMFRFRPFTRIKQLQHLLETAQIDSEFYWTHPVSVAPPPALAEHA